MSSPTAHRPAELTFLDCDDRTSTVAYTAPSATIFGGRWTVVLDALTLATACDCRAAGKGLASAIAMAPGCSVMRRPGAVEPSPPARPAERSQAMYHSDEPQGTSEPAEAEQVPELTEAEATAELDRLDAEGRAERA